MVADCSTADVMTFSTSRVGGDRLMFFQHSAMYTSVKSQPKLYYVDCKRKRNDTWGKCGIEGMQPYEMLRDAS